jgi:Domain of unknown function (DUF4345)
MEQAERIVHSLCMQDFVLSAENLAVFLVALAFLALGCTALLAPASIGRYFDVQITSIDGRNEIRAVYGGFSVAVTLALAIAVHVDSLRPGIIACVSLSLAGMAFGRLASALFERPGRWPWTFCALEAVGALALGVTHF